MNPRELCIKCGNIKPEDEGTYFCKKCKNKIIRYCWNYHNQLQNNQ